MPRQTPGRRVLAMLSVATLAGLLVTPVAFADPTAPTADDAASAQRNEDSAARDVSAIEVELATLSTSLDSAWEDALMAGEDFNEAQVALEDRSASAKAAAARLDGALTNMEASRKVLAGVALEQFRNGGSMRNIEAILSADGITEVIERTNSLEIVNGVADNAVQQFRADSLVASTMQEQADGAVAEAEKAAKAAGTALAAADREREKAEASIVRAEATRTDLIETLASARATSVAIETERQDSLDAAREQRVENEARTDREVNQPPSDAPEQSPPTQSVPQDTPAPTHPPTTNAPSRDPVPSVEPTVPATEPTAEPTRAPEPTRTPEPTRDPTPAPEQTRAPEPTPTQTPTPEPTRAPEPTPTQTPTPVKPVVPPATGTSNGTAAKGRAAVAWAKKRIGTPYGWGAIGPDAYDCSGLTSTAWASQGVNITRTSRTQYQAVKKIAYSQMRAGDLVFYAKDTSDPSTIYHVAMYAGNGQLVEARNYQTPLSLSPMRYAQSMPYVGRP